MEFDGTEYNPDHFRPDPKSTTHRCKDYTDRWIRVQECVGCGNEAVEGERDIMPMHRRSPNGGGTALKGPDKECLPGCHNCHYMADLHPRAFDAHLFRRHRKSWKDLAGQHWERYEKETG